MILLRKAESSPWRGAFVFPLECFMGGTNDERRHDFTAVSPKGPLSGSMRPTPGRDFLRALLALSLVYYTALVVDLALHPLAAADISGTIADRFLEALTGTGVLVVGAFIMRRVPGNRVGPLLMLYGVGVAGYSTR